MKSLKKKIAFVLVVATIALCLAIPALAAGSKYFPAYSTWESTVTTKMVVIMADGQCYVSLVLGSKSADGWDGVADIQNLFTGTHDLYALTTYYGATVYW